MFQARPQNRGTRSFGAAAAPHTVMYAQSPWSPPSHPPPTASRPLKEVSVTRIKQCEIYRRPLTWTRTVRLVIVCTGAPNSPNNSCMASWPLRLLHTLTWHRRRQATHIHGTRVLEYRSRASTSLTWGVGASHVPTKPAAQSQARLGLTQSPLSRSAHTPARRRPRCCYERNTTQLISHVHSFAGGNPRKRYLSLRTTVKVGPLRAPNHKKPDSV